MKRFSCEKFYKSFPRVVSQIEKQDFRFNHTWPSGGNFFSKKGTTLFFTKKAQPFVFSKKSTTHTNNTRVMPGA
jgi:hypothetical protein